MLCVNIFDDIEYISRTISFIEASGTCIKVIGLVIFPIELVEANGIVCKRKIGNDEIEKFKVEIKTKLNRDVFALNNSLEIDLLYNMILKNFSTSDSMNNF